MLPTLFPERVIYRAATSEFQDSRNRQGKKRIKEWKHHPGGEEETEFTLKSGKRFSYSPSALQNSPFPRESPASWMIAMKRSPTIRQATWWVWHRQWRTWWEAGNSHPAANVAAKKIALTIKPRGYKVNLMSSLEIAVLEKHMTIKSRFR